MRSQKHFDSVTIQNPTTNQILTVSVKLFETIYSEKGFNEVSRDNAKAGLQKGKSKQDNGPVSSIGSAADMAAKLGIDPNAKAAAEDPILKLINDAKPPAGRVSGEPLTAARNAELSEMADDIARGDLETDETKTDVPAAGSGNAETSVIDEGKKTNENDANIDGDASEGRKAAKRDRGRGN